MAQIQQIFDAVRTNLANRRDHVAHILSGPRCEQWLNPESRAAVNATVLSQKEHVNAEVYRGSQRPDLEVCRVNALADDVVILQIGEAKVVWNEVDKDISTPLFVLRGQIDGNHNREPAADSIGLIYAVWHANKAGERGNEDEATYFARVEGILGPIFPVEKYDSPCGTKIQTVFSKVSTRIGIFATTLSLGFTLVRWHEETPAERKGRLESVQAGIEAKLHKQEKIAEIRKRKPLRTDVRRRV